MARHILHTNKLPIDFLPNIVPIAIECKFQDVTCSNILLWAGAEFLTVLWPYLLVNRCCIPSSLLAIFTWFSRFYWNTPLHSSYWSGQWNLPTFLPSISQLVVCIFQSYNWASLFPSFHLPVLQLGSSFSNLKFLLLPTLRLVSSYFYFRCYN